MPPPGPRSRAIARTRRHPDRGRRVARAPRRSRPSRSSRASRRRAVLDVQVVIENEALNVAAVDPATYRNYTPLEVADSQDVWDRVAGGELGAQERLARSSRRTRTSSSRSAAPTTPRRCTSAPRPTAVAEVDAVVNETWIDDLGMVADNALLVRTGTTAPKKVAKQPSSSWSATPRRSRWSTWSPAIGLRPGRQADRGRRPAPSPTWSASTATPSIGGGRIAPEPAWVCEPHRPPDRPDPGHGHLQQVPLPAARGRAAGRRSTAASRTRSIPRSSPAATTRASSPASTKLSNHSFGLALDLNVPGNQRGTVGEMDRGVVAIFKEWGFGWGGDWGYTDPMHFEMNSIGHPDARVRPQVAVAQPAGVGAAGQVVAVARHQPVDPRGHGPHRRQVDQPPQHPVADPPAGPQRGRDRPSPAPRRTTVLEPVRRGA